MNIAISRTFEFRGASSFPELIVQNWVVMAEKGEISIFSLNLDDSFEKTDAFDRSRKFDSTQNFSASSHTRIHSWFHFQKISKFFLTTNSRCSVSILNLTAYRSISQNLQRFHRLRWWRYDRKKDSLDRDWLRVGAWERNEAAPGRRERTDGVASWRLVRTYITCWTVHSRVYTTKNRFVVSHQSRLVRIFGPVTGRPVSYRPALSHFISSYVRTFGPLAWPVRLLFFFSRSPSPVRGDFFSDRTNSFFYYSTTSIQ